ncbi:MAG: MarR family transcriptional regulator [Acidobacteria bacterium]|nr:MAG: MarR family transcriptional regulator [Acidobacteriota bacterium]
MDRAVSVAEYRALAEFRYQIRRFLNISEQAARAAGLEPQQYLLLLALRGLPEGKQATILTLAERLQLRHHSVVGLIDRLEKRGLVRRVRGKEDRRKVLISLTARGEQILGNLARKRLAELRATGPELVRALGAVVGAIRKSAGVRGASRSRGRYL